jgi:uncharacterized protein (DUF1015 family)
MTMSLVRAVCARLVTQQWAPRVVSPLHDVLTDTERMAVLAENPDSYLHVTSDPLALPGALGEDSDSAQVRALRRLLDLGAYQPMDVPAVLVYSMRDAGRDFTGIIAGVGLEGFADGRVLGHEAVQPDRVEGLVRHYERVRARAELVTLFHRDDPDVTELTRRVREKPPVLEFTDAGGIEQSVWQAGPDESEALERHLDRHHHYIADGHHRVAAATRWRERGGRTDSLLCVLYPEDRIVLHAFHRRVRGPVDAPALLERLRGRLDIGRADGPEVDRGSIGLYADGRWHVLVPHRRDALPGVAGLDVTMLDEQVLRPLLGIGGSERLEFLPDVHDLAPARRRCDEDGGVLFTLHAPALENLVSVAERHEVMSAKTTFVKPKPRTGIVLQ